MSLKTRLDRDVYQIVRKFEDQLEGDQTPKFTIDGIYNRIKGSNSSLAREKKRPLEDAIERVLRLRKQERLHDKEDSEGAVDEEMNDAPSAKPKERDYFLMNRMIDKSWNMSSKSQAAENAATPSNGTISSAVMTQDRQPNGEPKAKRRKAAAKEDRSPPAGKSLKDLGGLREARTRLIKDVARPLLMPWCYSETKTTPPRGVLLHGPPGCGKTALANALAIDVGVPFISVSAPTLVAGMSGESEKKIRELYEEAKSIAPCLVFIDEIDAIMGKRENAQREMERRIVAQMLTCMDELTLEKTGGKPVITIAATNRPDSLDPALRRAGRFNIEINVNVPDEGAREQILQALTKERELSQDVNLRAIAKSTPGFVGADLEEVIHVASSLVFERMDEQILATKALAGQHEMQEDVDVELQLLTGFHANANTPLPGYKLLLTQDDLLRAVSKVQPSAKREGFTTIPDTTWSQVGAMDDVRKKLSFAITYPIDDPETFAQRGISAASGVLLWGPPGCGKTLLAKAVANEAKANFISVKGPELLNKYVGESERSIRQVFSRARSSKPCILFFDELDALVPRRGDAIAESSARVVNMLLTELDGMDSRAGVYVVGATNRPEMIDPAILRPGRLGTKIFIDLPSKEGRVEILRTRIKAVLPEFPAEQLAALDPIARECEGFSGADLEALHDAAARASVERMRMTSVNDGLKLEDWKKARLQVHRSVSESQAASFRHLDETGWD